MTNIFKNKVNKQMLMLLTCQFIAGGSAFAHLTLEDIKPEEYKTTYNRLPSIEDSNNHVKARTPELEEVLKKAEIIVKAAGLEDYVGIRLVHSHFPVNNGQVMVEKYKEVEGVSSLVTRARDLEVAKRKNALPSSWIFSGNKQEDTQVFETSTDHAVQAGVQKLRENPNFFKEMGELLRSSNFNTLLSVAVLKRDSLSARPEESFLELNDGNLERSTIQAWNPQKMPQAVFRTSWTFNGAAETSCLKITYCVDSIPGHPKVEYHKGV